MNKRIFLMICFISRAIYGREIVPENKILIYDVESTPQKPKPVLKKNDPEVISSAPLFLNEDFEAQLQKKDRSIKEVEKDTVIKVKNTTPQR